MSKLKPQCATCHKRFDLKRFDYSTIGCEHTDMDGFICMAFADENIAIWMVGINEDTEGCEVYTERKSEWNGMRRESKNLDIKDAEIVYIKSNH